MQYLNYTQYHKEPGGIKKLNFIVDSIKDLGKKKISILDIGCGNGNVSFPLGYLGHDVLAIDISANLINKNSKKNKFKNLNFKTLDLNDSKFNLSQKFDVVLLLDILEHLENPKQLLINIKKICKKDAILIISIPNGLGFSELISRFVRGIEEKTSFKFVDKFKKQTGRFSIQSENYTPHLHFFTFERIVSLIEKCGYKLVKQSNSTIFSSSLRWSGKLEEMDIKLADKLPSNLASGWYLVFQN